MAKRPTEVRAGIFNAWNGVLTGAGRQPEGKPVLSTRNQTWNSVQKRQSPRTFTLDEVRRIVSEAVAAATSGELTPEAIDKALTDNLPVVEVEEAEEEFVVRGR